MRREVSQRRAQRRAQRRRLVRVTTSTSHKTQRELQTALIATTPMQLPFSITHPTGHLLLLLARLVRGQRFICVGCLLEQRAQRCLHSKGVAGWEIPLPFSSSLGLS